MGRGLVVVMFFITSNSNIPPTLFFVVLHFLYIYGQTSRTFLIYLCFHVLTILIENIKDVVAIIEIFLRSFSYSTRPHTIYTCFHALANVDTSF